MKKSVCGGHKCPDCLKLKEIIQQLTQKERHHMKQLLENKATIKSLTEKLEHKDQLLLAKDEINQNLQEMLIKEKSIKELLHKLAQVNERPPNIRGLKNASQEASFDNRKFCTCGYTDSLTNLSHSYGSDYNKSDEEFQIPSCTDSCKSTEIAIDVRKIQGNKKSNHMATNDRSTRKPSKMSEKEMDDLKPKKEEIDDVKPKEEEICNVKPREEEICNVKPKKEENQEICDMKPKTAEICDVKPKEEEMCDVKPKEKEICDVKPKREEMCDVKPKEVEICDVKPKEEEICNVKPKEEELCDVKPKKEENPEICDIKPKREEICYVKPKEEEMCDVKPREEEMCNVKPKEEEICDVKPNKEENQEICDVTPKREEMCDVKPKKEEICDVKPKKVEVCDVKLKKEEICDVNPKEEGMCDVKPKEEAKLDVELQKEEKPDVRPKMKTQNLGRRPMMVNPDIEDSYQQGEMKDSFDEHVVDKGHSDGEGVKEINDDSEESPRSALKYLEEIFNLRKKSDPSELNPDETYTIWKRISTQDPVQKTDVLLLGQHQHWPIYTYGFPYIMCDSYNQRHAGKSCGVVSMFYCYKFKKDPSTIQPPYGDVTDKIYKQVAEAVTEGNKTYSMYFEGTVKILDANDVVMMTNHLGVSIENQLEFESDHIDTVVEYVMTLKQHQFLLLFLSKPYRVFSFYRCDRGSNVQMFDSGCHPMRYYQTEHLLLGSFLLHTTCWFHTVKYMLQSRISAARGTWKFVVVELKR